MVVQNQSSIWVWLGPVLLFVGAMITLISTNMSANKREWNKWRRDTLIKLCSDAVSAAQDADAAYQSALDQKTYMFAQVQLNAASKAAAASEPSQSICISWVRTTSRILASA